MGRGDISEKLSEKDIRSWPRCFVEGASPDGPILLPVEEKQKFAKVLRLVKGDPIAILPNNGTLIHCRFEGSEAIPIEVFYPKTEPIRKITVYQALPKGDKADLIVNMCTQIGAFKFVFFPSQRTIVRWEPEKTESKLNRWRTIVRESCEVSFRANLPEIEYMGSLNAVLKASKNGLVLSEAADPEIPFLENADKTDAIIVGPEGGWAPDELRLIGDRGVSIGPRVLRTEFAAAAALAKLLI